MNLRRFAALAASVGIIALSFSTAVAKTKGPSTSPLATITWTEGQTVDVWIQLHSWETSAPNPLSISIQPFGPPLPSAKTINVSATYVTSKAVTTSIFGIKDTKTFAEYQFAVPDLSSSPGVYSATSGNIDDLRGMHLLLTQPDIEHLLPAIQYQPIPTGNLPEVPLAGALPIGLLAIGGVIWWTRRKGPAH